MMGYWKEHDKVLFCYRIGDMAAYTAGIALWGVVWRPITESGRWEAKIAPTPRGKKQIFLGAFATEQEARLAVERAVDKRARKVGVC